MIKTFNMMIFLFGIVLIVIGYTHNIKEECIMDKIEYRFIPKNTYNDLLYNNEMTEQVWKDMNHDDYMHNYSSIKAYNENDTQLFN
jgi:hypothetical protein